MAQPAAATKPTSTSGEGAKVSPEWKKPRTQEGAEAEEEPTTAASSKVHARHAMPIVDIPRSLMPPMFAGGSTLAGITSMPLTPAMDALSEVVPAEVALPTSSDEGGFAVETQPTLPRPWRSKCAPIRHVSGRSKRSSRV